MAAIMRAPLKYTITSTTAASTAGYMAKHGYPLGCIVNPTTVARAITWYGAYSSTRTTAYPVVDEDAVAATQTVAANSMANIHPAMAAVPIACCVTPAATGPSTVSLAVMWYG